MGPYGELLSSFLGSDEEAITWIATPKDSWKVALLMAFPREHMHDWDCCRVRGANVRMLATSGTCEAAHGTESCAGLRGTIMTDCNHQAPLILLTWNPCYFPVSGCWRGFGECPPT